MKILKGTIFRIPISLFEDILDDIKKYPKNKGESWTSKAFKNIDFCLLPETNVFIKKPNLLTHLITYG